MSSSVNISYSQPITQSSWMAFCRSHDIEFSPRTVGQNVFYRGGLGGVEIWFGPACHKEVPQKPDGSHDWDAVEPPRLALEIVVKSFYQRNLPLIAETTKDIQKDLGGSISSYDPELEFYLK